MHMHVSLLNDLLQPYPVPVTILILFLAQPASPLKSILIPQPPPSF